MHLADSWNVQLIKNSSSAWQKNRSDSYAQLNSTITNLPDTFIIFPKKLNASHYNFQNS